MSNKRPERMAPPEVVSCQLLLIYNYMFSWLLIIKNNYVESKKGL